MPRRPRTHLADHPQPIVQRDYKRAACFFAEEDGRYTLYGLKPGAEQYGGAVYAWVLMTNPMHRLLTPDAPNGISQGMQSLGQRDAQYVNCYYKRSGSVWEGRFKSSLIQAEDYLLTLLSLYRTQPGLCLDKGGVII